MKNKIFAVLVLSVFVSCSSFQKKPNSDEIIDKAVRELKEQLVKNYAPVSLKNLAIASFSRSDLIDNNKFYSQSVPELGEQIANVLQKEIFDPKTFTLLERQKIDSLVGEYKFSKNGLSNENFKDLELNGADLIVLGTLLKREFSIRVDARIVETHSGKVVSVASANLEITPFINELYEKVKLFQIEENRVEILSNEGWQFTGTTIEIPSQITISAEGQWNMTNEVVKVMNAEGLENNPSAWGDFRVSKDFNHGALICRFTKFKNNLFGVGTYDLEETGAIECRINDTDLKNNSGSIFLKISHKRK